MKPWNWLKEQHNRLRDRNMVIYTISIFVLSIILIPWLLQVPLIRSFVHYLLSFTDNPDYKIAYIELWGAMIGSFIAIYGALWTQRKIDRRNEAAVQRKYALILYYDLSLAIRDLREIFQLTHLKYHLDCLTGEDGIAKFASVALGRKLYLNESWISDVAELNDLLSPDEIGEIYKWYGKLTDIDRAMQSGNPTQIYNVFSHDICYFFAEDESTLRPAIQTLMDKIRNIAFL